MLQQSNLLFSVFKKWQCRQWQRLLAEKPPLVSCRRYTTLKISCTKFQTPLNHYRKNNGTPNIHGVYCNKLYSAHLFSNQNISMNDSSSSNVGNINVGSEDLQLVVQSGDELDPTSIPSAVQNVVLLELNTAFEQSLLKYGLKSMSVKALLEFRPLSNLHQLLNVPGVDYPSFMSTLQLVCQALLDRKGEVQPLLTRDFSRVVDSVLSACVLRGHIAFTRLSIGSAVGITTAPQRHAGTDEHAQQDTSNTDPRRSSTNGGDEQQDQQQQQLVVTNLGLMQVVDEDPRLHPHKLRCQATEALQLVPSAACYVLPNTRYSFSSRVSNNELLISLQQAQLNGIVQGLLAQRAGPSCLYYVRNEFTEDLFGLKVARSAIAKLPLMSQLLAGELQVSCLPRLSVTPAAWYQFRNCSDIDKRTIAPALYHALAFCTVLAGARNTAPHVQ